MKVAIVGSRNCGFLEPNDIMRHIPRCCTRIISGGAAGIDSLAEQAAVQSGIPFVKILPDYEQYGKAAPLMRNRSIVKEADRVLAFWDYHSSGTAHAIATCIDLHVPFTIIGLDEIEIDKNRCY